MSPTISCLHSPGFISGYDQSVTVPGQSVLPGTLCCASSGECNFLPNRRPSGPPIWRFTPDLVSLFSRSGPPSPKSTPGTCFLEHTRSEQAFFSIPGLGEASYAKYAPVRFQRIFGDRNRGESTLRMETNLLITYCGRPTKVISDHMIQWTKYRSGRKRDILLITTCTCVPHPLALPSLPHIDKPPPHLCPKLQIKKYFPNPVALLLSAHKFHNSSHPYRLPAAPATP